MVRAKKIAAKAEAVVEAVPESDEPKEVKKPAGRGKRKANEGSENSPPKRTLRSNSKTSLLEVKEVVPEKIRKAPTKTKKSSNEDSEDTNDQVKVVPENGVAPSKNDGKAKTDAPMQKSAGSKGKKTVPLSKTEAMVETDEEADEKSAEQTNGMTEKDKSKPVKTVNGTTKGKKKVETKTSKSEVNEDAAVPEEPAQPTKESAEVPEEETNDQAKTAAGRGKKKTEKSESDEVAPKKTKKDVTAKTTKPSKSVEPEEQKEEAEAKPAAGQTKKGQAKGKGAKTKEVAIEHCKS